jgi:hypothetical protein
MHDAGLDVGETARHSFQRDPLLFLSFGQRGSQFTNRTFQSNDTSRLILG